MIRRAFLMAATLTLGLGTSAAADDRGWSVMALGAWVLPDVSMNVLNDDGDLIHVDADDGFGYGLGLEYRINRRTGARLTWLSAQPEIELSADLAFPPLEIRLADELGFRPLAFAFDVHLTPDSPFDLYLAPVLAYVSYSSFEIKGNVGGFEIDPERFRIDEDFAFGAEIGFEVGLGDGPWSARGAVQYLDTVARVKDPEGESVDVDFDPITVTAGVSYRF